MLVWSRCKLLKILSALVIGSVGWINCPAVWWATVYTSQLNTQSLSMQWRLWFAEIEYKSKNHSNKSPLALMINATFPYWIFRIKCIAKRYKNSRWLITCIRKSCHSGTSPYHYVNAIPTLWMQHGKNLILQGIGCHMFWLLVNMTFSL